MPSRCSAGLRINAIDKTPAFSADCVNMTMPAFPTAEGGPLPGAELDCGGSIEDASPATHALAATIISAATAVFAL